MDTLRKMIGLGAVLAFSLPGAPILFTHTSFGTGSIGSTAFVNAPFTITAAGDTGNLTIVNEHVSFVPHDTASISIAGVGDFDFGTGTRTFRDTNTSSVGFSRAGASGADLLSGPTNPGFQTWDMLTSFGPVTGMGVIHQWSSSPVETAGGIVVLDFDIGVEMTFNAQVGPVVPEPGCWTLLVLGLAGMGLLKGRTCAM